MGKLFIFELRKLKKLKSIYICLGIMLALIILNAAVLAVMDMVLQDAEIDMIEETGVFGAGPFFGYSGFIKSTFSNSSFFIILGVLVSLYCCDDYTNGTIKNIYAKGYSHADVYFTKYLFSLVLSLLLACVCIIFSCIVVAIFGKKDVVGDKLAAVMVCQLIIVVGYHGIFYSVSMMLRKVGGSIAVNVLAPLILGIVLMLLTTIIQTVNESTNIDFGYIWFDSAINDLNEVPVKSAAFIKSVLMGIIYAGIFVPLGYVVNRRKEV